MKYSKVFPFWLWCHQWKMLRGLSCFWGFQSSSPLSRDPTAPTENSWSKRQQEEPLGFDWSVMSTQLRTGCSQSLFWTGQGCYQSCCTTLIPPPNKTNQVCYCAFHLSHSFQPSQLPRMDLSAFASVVTTNQRDFFKSKYSDFFNCFHRAAAIERSECSTSQASSVQWHQKQTPGQTRTSFPPCTFFSGNNCDPSDSWTLKPPSPAQGAQQQYLLLDLAGPIKPKVMCPI